jgi:hypothetical protein
VQQFVDILDAEYEQRRHASNLAAWINRKLQELNAGGRLEEQYFERRGRNVKRLLVEAVPLSQLGLELWVPGDEPYIALLPIAESVDAEINVHGFNARSFKVEVTTIETEESTMRRQALAREGMVPLAGPIRREGWAIVAEGEMVDVAEYADRIVDLTIQRLGQKVNSGAYDEATAMLVYLSELWPLPPEARLRLRRRTEAYLGSKPGLTSTVHFCFWPDYGIETVHVPRRKDGSLGAA